MNKWKRKESSSSQRSVSIKRGRKAGNRKSPLGRPHSNSDERQDCQGILKSERKNMRNHICKGKNTFTWTNLAFTTLIV